MKPNEHLGQQKASLTHKDKLELLARELAEAIYPLGTVPSIRAYETGSPVEKSQILRCFAAENARRRALGQWGIIWPETHEEYLRGWSKEAYLRAHERLCKEDGLPEPRGFEDRTDGVNPQTGQLTGGHEPWETGT